MNMRIELCPFVRIYLIYSRDYTYHMLQCLENEPPMSLNTTNPYGGCLTRDSDWVHHWVFGGSFHFSVLFFALSVLCPILPVFLGCPILIALRFSLTLIAIWKEKDLTF